MVFTPAQRNQKGQNESMQQRNKKQLEGGHGGGAVRPHQGTQLAVVVVLVSLAVLVVLVAFVALVAPFVFAALVVCAAGAVLQ
jgi:hypothetical protein